MPGNKSSPILMVPRNHFWYGYAVPRRDLFFAIFFLIGGFVSGFAQPAGAPLQIEWGGMDRTFRVSDRQFWLRGSTGDFAITNLSAAVLPGELASTAEALTVPGGTSGFVLFEPDKPQRLFLLTGEVLVRLDGTVSIQEVAQRTGLAATETSSAGYYLFSTNRPAQTLALAELFRGIPGVRSAVPQLARKASRKTVPGDRFFPNQWHLLNSGQNGGVPGIDIQVANVWTSYRGEGVVIGMIDDGLQVSHPDLQPNADTTIDWDFNGRDSDPSPSSADDHGTACAGLAAARGDNSAGVAGVAYRSTLVGLRLTAGAATDAMEAAAFSHSNAVIHIKSNSWGPDDDGITLEGPGPLAADALKSAAQNGRGGLGTIFTWAAGNGLEARDNSNNDGYANSIYTIAVTAVSDQGTEASYAEPGANIVVAAPSSSDGRQGIVTTDLQGTAGLNSGSFDLPDNNYTEDFGGTSAATPIVAGVAALMLQANPGLGWRDVQEILIRSATKNDAGDADWANNGAGFHFNHKYGAGMVNAEAAVNMAGSWNNLPAQETFSQTIDNLGAAIPDNNASGVVRTFSVNKPGFRLEHVTLTVSIQHPYRGDLEITLISPSGTASRLAEPHADPGDNYQWKFMTVRNWGEQASGTWTVRVADRSARDTGVLNSLRLDCFGTSSAEPALSAGGVSVSEPSSGSSTAVVTVSLSKASDMTVTVNYQTADGTATAGSDYQGVSGTLTFPPGTLQQTVSIPILADSVAEGSESFYLQLSAPSHAILSGPQSTITINGPNTAPRISSIFDQSVDEDGQIASLSFVVSDQETPAGGLAVSATSSNPALIPADRIVLGGTSGNRTARLSPLPNQAGQATITITVSDGELSASDSFVLRVNPINDLPVISGAANRSVALGQAIPNLTLGVSDVETDAGSLVVTAVPDDPEFIPSDRITVEGQGGTRVIHFDPVSDHAGSSKITITVQDLDGGTSSVAIFLSVDFPDAVRSYRGLLMDSHQPDFGGLGSITIRSAASGSFSGEVVTEGVLHRISGILDSTGSAQVSIPQSSGEPATLELNLGLNGLRGFLHRGSRVLEAAGEVQPFNLRTHPSSFAGRYSVVIPQPDGSANRFGTGYLSLSVDGSGRVRYSGMTGDGTKVAGLSGVSETGRIPIFNLLYEKSGVAAGWLEIANPGKTVAGSLRWLKPARPQDALFPGGFDEELAPSGEEFKPLAAGESLWTWTDGAGSISLDDGVAPFASPILLSATQMFVADDRNVHVFWNKRTGEIRGTALHPSGKRITFSGVILRTRKTASGVFVGPHGVGRLLISD